MSVENPFIGNDREKENDKKTSAEIFAEELKKDNDDIEKFDDDKLHPKTKEKLRKAFRKYHAEKN